MGWFDEFDVGQANVEWPSQWIETTIADLKL
jgi:hypothetical protein